MTNSFLMWYGVYGIMDDHPNSQLESGRMKRVAYRAYKKGRKDALKFKKEKK